MRGSFVFVIIWVLLFLCLIGQALGYFGEYRIQRGLVEISRIPIGTNTVNQETVGSVTEKAHEQLLQTLDSATEILLLGALGALYFQKNKRATKIAPVSNPN